MAVRLSAAQAKRYGVRTPVSKTPTARQRYGGYRSSWEQEYAAYLGRVPQIQTWHYEAIRLTLAPKTTYTPDFLVVRRDGALEMHEVKGHPRPAGMVKIKVAARLFPMFRFYLVRKVRHVWEYTEVHH